MKSIAFLDWLLKGRRITLYTPRLKTQMGQYDAASPANQVDDLVSALLHFLSTINHKAWYTETNKK